MTEFLELLEGFHHVFLFGQGLGLFAIGRFGLQVFLEVQIPEFPVDIHQVVELGDIKLISIVDVPEILLRNRADFPPAVLDFTELGESILHIGRLLHEDFKFHDDGLFFGEVLFPLGILFPVEFCALLLVLHIEGLESRLDGSKGADGATLHRDGGGFLGGGVLVRFFHHGVFSGLGLFPGEALIEGRLDGFGLLGPLHTVFTFG